ncbi:MAG: ATP-binding protein [Candidatus Dormibacteraeota bacterium]|uniref:ATP-binding protein n=1 Tax=Candidatus Amunia macphersoniae TaxID=3127014 RepID=A0A934NJY2_9BACT|nr:ATP-binding protein [Candidatus Dormibacteraeota bacterium]
MAQALDTLASRQPTIEVIGVTDYFTTASFRRAADAWARGAGPSIRSLFPNVELRLDIPTTRGSGVNLHLLCPAEEVDALDRFLGSLEFTWRDRPFRADRGGLIDLGRSFSSDPGLDEEAAIREGAKQFKVTFEALRKQFRADAWAKQHCLVALAGGQGDGSSGVRVNDNSFEARRQSIEAFADIIFSANPQQSTFWLGQGADSPTRLRDIYGGTKPCLHGSDAHNVAALGLPAADRFTWLKGDASFETLRTACLAPESRVHIGPLPPTAGHGHGRIRRIGVHGQEWFVGGDVAINPGLVAIIGARGSGKTALADLLAVGAGSNQPFTNAASFIRRAAPLLQGSEVEVEWSHGDVTKRELSTVGESLNASDRAVRYLSQQFVEQLCASDGVSDDLLHEIERVVFNAWPVDQRQGSTTFAEFLDIRLSAARLRQQAELVAIADLGEAITDQRVLKDGLPKRVAERNDQIKRLQALAAQTRDLTKRGGLANSERLSIVSGALELRQQQLQRLDRQVTDLSALADQVRLGRERFRRDASGLRERHSHAGLPDPEWSAFNAEFVGDVDAIIASALATSRTLRSTFAGATDSQEAVPPLDALSADELAKKTFAELRADRQRLQHLVGLDDTRTRQLMRLNDQSDAIRATIAKLENEIAAASEAEARSSEVTQLRLEHYASYFDALLEEENELRNLYAPLGTMLGSFGPSVAKLHFSVRRKVGLDTWAAAGEELIDLRKAGVFRGAGELANIALQELSSGWQSGDGTAAAEAIRSFSAKHSSDLRQQARSGTEDPVVYREWERSVSRWLYAADHVTLSYSLEYDGLDIGRLSPGSRGIVLLLLYLAVDQEETDPLIIDQPEENLDPESVYAELVNLFRQASRRRQIIMVTHNANLVVNTDVDQVIVARCGTVEEGRLPELTYLSGGLEQPAVRKAVCEVLEGGAEAFRQRARRLRLDFAL